MKRNDPPPDTMHAQAAPTAPPAATAPSARTADAAWRRLHAAATEPYRAGGRFGYHFARGKLGRDPVFRGLIDHGLIERHHRRVLDIGSGQSLIVNLLAAMARLRPRESASWPAGWQQTPEQVAYTGIELMQRDIDRARPAMAGLVPVPQLVCADMCRASFPACDLVVILDVLHYVDHAAQEDVLRRVWQALAPGGRLLLRVGDTNDRRGFAVSQWVDRTVTRIRGHRVSPTWGRALPQWQQLLQAIGFEVRAIPMSRGTPFANVLLVADRPLTS